MQMEQARVVSVSRDDKHRFSKPVVPAITLLAGLGVEGDSHAGATTRHRYLMRKDPSRPNLTQVHLIPVELFAELADRGFDVVPGELGENITTSGLELRELPLGTRLRIGADAVIEITGLRSPCSLIDKHRAGLRAPLLERDATGRAVRDERGALIRKAGIMGIVVAGGRIEPGDGIRVELPAGVPIPLDVV